MTQQESNTNDETESFAESLYVKAVAAAIAAAAFGVIFGYEAAAAGVTKAYAVMVIVLLIFLFYGIVEAYSAIHELRS